MAKHDGIPVEIRDGCLVQPATDSQGRSFAIAIDDPEGPLTLNSQPIIWDHEAAEYAKDYLSRIKVTRLGR